MLTDNPVLLRRHKELPALNCFQRKATKIVPTELDFVQSNIDNFGSDIGTVTNRLTAMYERQALFEKDSIEYKTLAYRIEASQQIQQNSIDAAKGIEAKPMPKEWYDWRSVDNMPDGEQKELYKRIIVETKPYFMIHIYPTLKRQYRDVYKRFDVDVYREFGIHLNELMESDPGSWTERQRELLWRYHFRSPVGDSMCVMNKICRRFETDFKSSKIDTKEEPFDYRIMKSGVLYSKEKLRRVSALYEKYNLELSQYKVRASKERIQSDEVKSEISVLKDYFKRQCLDICSNEEELCDMLLDICYTKSSTKKFVWDMCARQIIKNLSKRNGYIVSMPVQDDRGDIQFGGRNFSVIRFSSWDELQDDEEVQW